MIKNLQLHWNRHFSGVLPIADTFRTTFNDRWVRFHSLPESKRYAESESEYQTVFFRHNSLIARLCKDSKLILMTAFYSGNSTPVKDIGRSSFNLFELDPSAKHWQTVALHEIDSELGTECYLHFFASEWNWSPAVFDPILKLVADDVLRNVSIFSLEGNWLYHPYDGGADVICTSVSQRNLIRKEFSEWLSGYSGGL